MSPFSRKLCIRAEVNWDLHWKDGESKKRNQKKRKRMQIGFKSGFCSQRSTGTEPAPLGGNRQRWHPPTPELVLGISGFPPLLLTVKWILIFSMKHEKTYLTVWFSQLKTLPAASWYSALATLQVCSSALPQRFAQLSSHANGRKGEKD